MGSLLPALALAAMSLSPCHIEGFPEEVLCGTHRVFEDRAARSGRTIDLRVAVVPALRRESADDPLFILAGGPGQGATEYGPLIPLAFREVRKTRDVVLVDLRGTGRSNPLTCEMGDPLAMLGEGAFDAAPCLRSLKGDPRLYTTAPAMDDLDEVRAALGYERINLWGGSYGTRAALVYAQRHPERVRTVVLDGAAPFEIALPLYNAWGAQRALDRLLADCAAEPACRSAYPRLREELDEVFSRLDRGAVRRSTRPIPPAGRTSSRTSAWRSGRRSPASAATARSARSRSASRTTAASAMAGRRGVRPRTSKRPKGSPTRAAIRRASSATATGGSGCARPCAACRPWHGRSWRSAWRGSATARSATCWA